MAGEVQSQKADAQKSLEEKVKTFKDTMDKFMDPTNHHALRWRDVEDARYDVVRHHSALIRDGKLKAPGSEGQPAVASNPPAA